MIHVRGKVCPIQIAPRERISGRKGVESPEFCSLHAKDGMVDVCNKRCSHTGCTKQTKAEFCARHASEGVIDAKRKKPKVYHMSVISGSVKQELRAGAEPVSGLDPSEDGGKGGGKRARAHARRTPGADAAAVGLFVGLRKKGRR